MRAIDFWVIMCYTGEFAALMEYIVVLHLTQFFMAEDRIDNQEGNNSQMLHFSCVFRKKITVFSKRQKAHRPPIYVGSLKKRAPIYEGSFKAQKLYNSQRLMIANIIETVTKFLLPLYNIVFPIIYFVLCTSEGAK